MSPGCLKARTRSISPQRFIFFQKIGKFSNLKKADSSIDWKSQNGQERRQLCPDRSAETQSKLKNQKQIYQRPFLQTFPIYIGFSAVNSQKWLWKWSSICIWSQIKEKHVSKSGLSMRGVVIPRESIAHWQIGLVVLQPASLLWYILAMAPNMAIKGLR